MVTDGDMGSEEDGKMAHGRHKSSRAKVANQSPWPLLIKSTPLQVLLVTLPYAIITYVFIAYLPRMKSTNSLSESDAQFDPDVSLATRELEMLYQDSFTVANNTLSERAMTVVTTAVGHTNSLSQPTPANVSEGNALHRITREPVLRPEDFNITGYIRPHRVFLTIGIPTIYRLNAGTSYVKGTMESLISHTSDEEKEKVIILLFLADFNETSRREVSSFVTSYYQQYLDSGFIQMLEVRREAYPPLTGLKRNFNDEPLRVSWRSKQVIDFAFMFYYGRDLSDYYLQIEDDVVSAPQFLPKIQSFIKQQKKPWVTLQFSELGFIAKLYRSSDLDRFSRFLVEFYSERPVDFLHSDFARILTLKDMPLLKPTLFQHMGRYSSLVLSKTQKLNKAKDKYFKTQGEQASMEMPKKHKAGDNPPASFFTTMEVYKKNTPDKVYDTRPDAFFWAITPAVNDCFIIVFKEAQYLEEVIVETGRTFQMNDYLRHGVLLVSGELVSMPTGRGQMPTCANYTQIAQFDAGRVEVENIDQTRQIRCLKILVTRAQKEWLIIDQVIIWKAKTYR